MSFEEEAGGGGGGGGYSAMGVSGMPLMATANHTHGGGPGMVGMMSTASTPNNTIAGGSEDELNCTLWVGNLDSQVSEELVQELFARCGPITKVHIPKGKDGMGHKGYCFVQFANEETVPYSMSCMEGTSLYGKILRLQPRPGSKHRKIMDQLQAEKQQLQQMHPQQMLQTQQPQQQQQQWFVSAAPHPQLPQQMAQFQNVLLYPPQMYQPYGGIPNMNMNSSVIPIQYSPGIGMPVIPMPVVRQQQQQQIPVQQQQSSQTNPHYHPRGPRTEFRSSRPNTRPQMNGYHQSLHQRPQTQHLNGSAQASHYSNSSATNVPTSTPSSTSTSSSSSQPQSNQTVLNNGSQSSTRFPHTRGPRPQHQQHRLHQQTGPRSNGNNSNNNNLTSPVNGNPNRLPYNNQRSVAAIATHMPHPQQHTLQSPTGYVQQQLIPAQLYQSPQPTPYYSFPPVNAPDQQQQYYQQNSRRPMVQLHPQHGQPPQTAGLVSFPVTNIYPPYQ